MWVKIQFSQAYFWLDSWILANIIQLATQDFCEKFVDYKMDPGRRLTDQMLMAARCGVANIAEGSARHSTSVETEMRLLDVARASFDELQGDFLILFYVEKQRYGLLEILIEKTFGKFDLTHLLIRIVIFMTLQNISFSRNPNLTTGLKVKILK